MVTLVKARYGKQIYCCYELSNNQGCVFKLKKTRSFCRTRKSKFCGTRTRTQKYLKQVRVNFYLHNIITTEFKRNEIFLFEINTTNINRKAAAPIGKIGSVFFSLIVKATTILPLQSVLIMYNPCLFTCINDNNLWQDSL